LVHRLVDRRIDGNPYFRGVRKVFHRAQEHPSGFATAIQLSQGYHGAAINPLGFLQTVPHAFAECLKIWRHHNITFREMVAFQEFDGFGIISRMPTLDSMPANVMRECRRRTA
jgi:hypothetical protein